MLKCMRRGGALTMKNIVYMFQKFLYSSLKVLFLIPVIGSIIFMFVRDDENLWFSIFCFFISLILIGGTYYSLKNNYKKSLIIAAILYIAFIIRILWFYSLDSIPIGDFNRMFICAEEYLKGGTYMFKDTAYFARFPHMSITVLYFSLIMKIFSNPLIATRFINIIFSMVNIILLYLISNEIFKDNKKNIWVLLISSIYPPMIVYNNVYCSENIAMPLLLLSVLMFLKASKENKSNKFLLILTSGITLGIMQLFRPNGYVMITAYIMYIFIYLKEGIKTKVIETLLIISTFIIPLVIVSHTLMALNITENPLWHGAEPMSISILKGTNIDAKGAWNEEDAAVFNKYDGDYETVDKAAKEIIKERLTTTPIKDLLTFYIFKYANEWRSGDFAGVYWAQVGLEEAYNKEYYLNILGKDQGRMLIKLSDDMQIYSQIFFIIVLIFSYIGLYTNRKVRNYQIDFLYIMFCGISLQSLMIEAQTRYTYPFSWVFIILAVSAFSRNNISSNGGSKWKVLNIK